LSRYREFLLPSVVLDRTASEALHRQIARQIADAIRGERLRVDTRLPSTRLLARVLQVSRNTVVAAYEELVADGLIRAFPGAGMRANAPAPLSGMPSAGARRLLDEAHFPAKVAPIEDLDGNPLYLRY
jgi:GntR family transcriptional regulator / MocR family aminotransferase